MNHSDQLAKKFLELTKKLDMLVKSTAFEENMPEIERIINKREEVIQEIDALEEERGSMFFEYLNEASVLEKPMQERYQKHFEAFSQEIKGLKNKRVEIVKNRNARMKYAASYGQSSGVFIDKKK